MTLILTSLVIILIIIKYSIFLDVILSWLSVFGLNIRPNFLSSILDPIYSWVKSKISTSFGPLDFTPIIIFLLIEFLIILIYGIDKNVQGQINNLSSFLNF